MDENKRRELAARLKVESIPDVIADDDYIEFLIDTAYPTNDEEHWKELLEEARRLLGIYHSAPGSTTPPGRGVSEAPLEIEVKMSDSTRERAVLLAALLGMHPEVRRFRRLLSNWPLASEEATHFEGDFFSSQSKLDRLSRKLARQYRWRVPEVRRFILCGEPPSPVTISEVPFRTSARSDVPIALRITLTADVWVPPAEVAAVFQSAQRQILGRATRKLHERTLRVGHFVAEETVKADKMPPWPELWRSFNRAYPKYAFKDYRGLRQAFVRLMHPKHNLPKWKRRDSS